MNLIKAFGRKEGEHNLTERFKDKLDIMKKPHKYSISSIIDPAVKVSTHILVGKIMQKCHVDEVSAPIVSLAT